MAAVTDVQLMGGCTYLGRLETTGERVVVQVPRDECEDFELLFGTVGTPRFLQYGARGFHTERVVVASVPDGEYLDRVENPRSMLRELMRVFRAMDERGLAMVEFDEKSVLATSEGCVCLVDVACSVRRKDGRPPDDVDGCPPDDSFDYDQNTVWRIGRLVEAFDPSATDLLQRVFVTREIRITLAELLDYF